MMRLLLLTLFLFTAYALSAQLPGVCPPGQIALSNTCAGACVLCDFQTFTSSNNTTNQGQQVPPGFCPGQAIFAHNVQWIGFVAGSTNITMTITPTNCALAGSQGLQAGVWGTSDCNSFNLVSNCLYQVPPNQPSTLTLTGLTVGGTYFFVVDGFNDDVCDFTVNVTSGSTTVQPVAGVPTISPSNIVLCPGGTFPFSTTIVPNAGVYNWTLNGQPVGAGQNVNITIPPSASGTVTICVTPSNLCHGPGTPACQNYQVVTELITLPPQTICPGQSYTVDGNTFSAAGTYDYTTTTPQGCVLQKRITINVQPTQMTSLVRNLCPGQTVVIGNQVFGASGFYTVPLQTSFGCDSIVTLNLTVHNIPPTILNEEICSNAGGFTVGNTTYNTTGQYVVTLSSFFGCDSIVALNLTVYTPTVQNISATICQGQFYELGNAFYTTSGTYQQFVSGPGGCINNVTLNLTVSNPQSTVNPTICNGQTYSVGNSTYNASGTYTKVLSGASSLGCDSTVTINLTVLPPIATTLNQTLCASQGFTVGSNTYFNSGTYVNTLTASNGCDSVVTLNLVSNPEPVTNLSPTICAGATFTVGSTAYDASGTYQNILSTVAGCDSTVNLNLTVLPAIVTNLTPSICDGDSFTVGGTAYTTAGNYTNVLTATNGCDSTVNLNLTVLPIPQTTLNISICEGESYTVGSSSYDTNGTYEDVLTAATGCDSVVTLNLNVIPPLETFLNVGICTGQSYTLGGNTYSTAGTYSALFTSAIGCDSVVYVDLTINDLLTNTLNISLCNGESFTVGNSTYSTTGTYQDFFVTPSGCDSLLILNLNILPTPQTPLTVSICNGESYTVGSSVYTLTGNYTDVLTAANGCDSTVTLNLTVLNVPQVTLNEAICDGESFSVGASTYNTGGTYTDILTAANGCDSIVTLNLTILNVPQVTLDESICDGESFAVGTSSYTATGTYTDVLTAANGCDSIVTLNLTVLNVPQVTLTEAICAGETFAVGASSYTASGVYTDVLTAANGCDSIVTLSLTVHPIPVTNIVTSICDGASYTVGTSSYSTSGTYQDILTAFTGCDSIVNLTLTITSFYETNLTRSICDGESFTVGTSVYTTTGMYQDLFIALDGCDSIVNLNLTVFAIPVTNLSPTICDGETFTVGSSTYSVSGTFQDVLTAFTGCDSIVNLNLTVNPVFTTILTEAICDGESFTVGTSTYTVSGTYTDVLTATNNCDSTVTLNLTVHPIPVTNLTEIVCAGASFTVGSSTYSTSGTYQDVLTAFTGCDSIVNLNLTVRTPITTSLTRAICDGESFAVGSSSYTVSGTFTDVLTSAATGCDSTVTLNLTVHPIPVTNLTEIVCAGQSFTVGTSTYSASGTYQNILTAFTGCDSIVNLNLTVRAPITTGLTQAICDGETFTVGTTSYGVNGVYTNVLTASNGCDSTVTLNLTVHPIPLTNLAPVICAGESFTVGSSTYSASGSYQNILTAFTGCDSIVNLNLTVRAPITTALNRAICQGQSFSVGSSSYTAAGTYSDILTSVTGCDSTVTLNLTVNPVYQITLNERICDDQTFTVGTSNFSTTGTFQVTLVSISGCDSIVTLNLITHPCTLQLTSVTAATGCFGQADGSVRFSMTVGTPPYSYTWQAIGGGQSGNGNIGANGVETVINGLPAGNYRITVIDFYNITRSFDVTVTQPAPVVVSLAGSNYNGFGVSCPGDDDGVVTTTVSGGATPYSYLWSNGSTQPTLRDVPSGTYFLTLTDANGCTSSPANPTITLTAPPPITLAVTPTDLPCFGQSQGSIAIDTVTGGVPPYLYAIDNDPFSARSLFGGLPVGNYTIRVQDANGCTQSMNTSVNQPQQLTVDLGPDIFINLGDSVRLDALASYPVETYLWQGGGGLSCDDCPSPSARPFETVSYGIVVTDRNGCTATDQIIVFVDKGRNVFFPTAFSPNDDGINDRFYPFSGSNVSLVKTFLVFNRWGETMYELYNFEPNNPAYGWDGSHRSRPLNTGVYVFVAEVEFIDGETVIFKGDVTLMR
jgi:gliding motility-associated-like protein